jgi:hypothetical protein
MFAPLTARATATPVGWRAILYRATNGGRRREVGAVVTCDGGALRWSAAPIPGGPAAMARALADFRAHLDTEHGGADGVARRLAEQALIDEPCL